MIEIKGIIVSGIGAATSTLKQQLPHFKPFLEDRSCLFAGTINVELECPFYVLEWDCVTHPIHWYEEDPNQQEKFGFLRIKFISSESSEDAWIYDPHGSPHRNNPFVVEVLAKELPVNVGDSCRLGIDRGVSTKCVIVK